MYSNFLNFFSVRTPDILDIPCNAKPAIRERLQRNYLYVEAGEFCLVLKAKMPWIGMRIPANLAIQLCVMFGVGVALCFCRVIGIFRDVSKSSVSAPKPGVIARVSGGNKNFGFCFDAIFISRRFCAATAIVNNVIKFRGRELLQLTFGLSLPVVLLI